MGVRSGPEEAPGIDKTRGFRAEKDEKSVTKYIGKKQTTNLL